MGKTKRVRNIYQPNSKQPFKLSRSRLEHFIQCPLCFYIDRRLGISQPSTPPFNLNIAVDLLFKKEFDYYREKQEPHPIMVENNVEAVPLEHPSLEIWRNPFTGIQYHHRETNLIIFGGVDDIWKTKDGELIIVDYKATSTESEITLDDPWKAAYKRQLEIYQWLFRKNDFKVSDTSYLVYANALKSEPAFNDRLSFKTKLIRHDGDDSWIEKSLGEVYACLQADTPPEPTAECEFCDYRKWTGEISRSSGDIQTELEF